MIWAGRLRLELELGRWRAMGVRPTIWWRDDDARRLTPALDRLLRIAAGRPLALAVIPDGAPEALATLALTLATAPAIRVGQHGVDHLDRSHLDGSQGGAPRSEYRESTTAAEIGAAIAEGRERLRRAGLEPCFYTPPWNSAQPALASILPELGFETLSAGRTMPDGIAITYASTDVDLLRWKGGPAFRGADRIYAALAKALHQRRGTGALGTPVGLLTHHLAHDEATWRFLPKLLRLCDGPFDWVAIGGNSSPRSTQGRK